MEICNTIFNKRYSLTECFGDSGIEHLQRYPEKGFARVDT